MKKAHFIALSTVLILLGCKENQINTSQEKVKEEPVEIIDKHTSEIALDWNGTYKGLLPCVSCPGILTTVKLNTNKTFERTEFFLETKNGYLRYKGTFSFTEDGGKIVLKFKTGSTTMYAVGENRLTMLDEKGKKITSELAEMYEMTKVKSESIEFCNESIKGLLTFGHEVSIFEPCGSSMAYWIKDFPDGRLTNLYKEKIGKQPTPYTPVMAELVVKYIGKAEDGFAEQYDGVLEIVEIKSVELITPENYCNN